VLPEANPLAWLTRLNGPAAWLLVYGVVAIPLLAGLLQARDLAAELDPKQAAHPRAPTAIAAGDGREAFDRQELAGKLRTARSLCGFDSTQNAAS
jgi:hypothetical protein